MSLDTIQKIMKAKCINRHTTVGLEGGEFLLHPQADEILEWFSLNHPNFDIFSNCLKPERLITAVRRYKPKRLYVSLDGTPETYHYMRGKDGYENVREVISALKSDLPVFVMFTLSPYNDFSDLAHVATLCRDEGVFLRVGIYNNIPFFDTIDNAKQVTFGQMKNRELLTFGDVQRQRKQHETDLSPGVAAAPRPHPNYRSSIPEEVGRFSENLEYISLYENWLNGETKLGCHSILDSLVVLPDGTVPVCQSLGTRLGNVHEQSLDEIFNSSASSQVQRFHCKNCNQCWVSYHRKYDIVLYRTAEKLLGRNLTGKLLGYYKWESDEKKSCAEAIAQVDRFKASQSE
jgi:MoaA/NifB/PqqE/SkfB family radical SAM enzyme